MTRPIAAFAVSLGLLLAIPWTPAAAQKQSLTIGIGTQDTTTNTATGGTVIREMKLFEKYLPHDGKYANLDIKLDWQNYTSGPPVTNGMVADKLQIGMMGDYPLLVNGATFQASPDSKSYLVAVIAYNMSGAGNGVVVAADSPYYALSDLKGKLISVPFGSAAHGMLLKAMQDNGWSDSFWQVSNQSPEIGATNLQEHKIDAHADFVPFAELLPLRGYARKIFDGAETGVPTFHGIVVRADFADKYPELVVAYLRGLLEANAWLKADPKAAATKIEGWTKIEKEVVYIFLGPGGIMTTDPTIKPGLVEAIKYDTTVLQKLGRVEKFDADKWVNDKFIREAFKQSGLDYDKQLASSGNYQVAGTDTLCKLPVADPRSAGEIWVEGGDIQPFANPACTLSGAAALKAEGKKLRVVYTVDQAKGIKLFADKAYYAVGKSTSGGQIIEPYLLKADAEKRASALGGKTMSYDEALTVATH
jgi:NitT/TauT family transport system substrate-binding protein